MKNKKRCTRRWVENGITRKEQDGYIFVRIGNLWTGEHRLIVEDRIGRVLNCHEVIHHIDEIRNNNLIDNLMIFPNQKAHQRFHLKLRQFGMTEPIKRQIVNRWKEFENE